MTRSVESGSAGSHEGVHGLGGSALEVVRFWESNVLLGKLFSLLTTHLRAVEDGGSDDLDRVLGSAMTTSHLHVHLGDGTAEGNVSVLLVHVNGTSAGQVTKNDTVVSDGTTLSLEDLRGGDDLTLDLADLVLSLHVVPELGPGENGVSVEHSHAVELGLWVLGRWERTTHDVELSTLRQGTTRCIRHVNSGGG